MTYKSKIKLFITKKENLLVYFFAFLFSINMLFLGNRKSIKSIFSINQNPDIFYFIFILVLCLFIIIFFYKYKKNITLNLFLQKLFSFFLPFEIALFISIFIFKSDLNFLFFIFFGLYFFFSSIFILKKYQLKFLYQTNKTTSIKILTFAKIKSQKNIYTFLAFIVICIHIFIGTKNISNFAAVDEALWTFDRIPSFWKNIREMDWKGTGISDKPGITLAAISGIGLINLDPKMYDTKDLGLKNLDIKDLNRSFRLPITIFISLSLFLLYFFLEKLFKKRIALLSLIAISFSPILIGIGRIINPDAFLWLFSLFSIITFLIFQKENKNLYLYLSGLFIGLAILTKYVANILFIFIVILIFLEYVFNQYKKINFKKYLSYNLLNFLILILISLLTIYSLFPAIWINPEKILKTTILSQAFASTWIYFVGLLFLLFFDLLIFKKSFSEIIINFIASKRKIFLIFTIFLFIFISIFLIINAYINSYFYNFENILSSPKTSYKEFGFIGLFLANFYPLIFGISPILLISTLLVLLKIFIKNKSLNKNLSIAIFFMIFIFIYYIATTINDVVSTSRYQIILYPLILIISAIGISETFSFLEKKYRLSTYIFFLFSFFFFIILFFSVVKIRPFYLSYSSEILPKNNIIDVKDMGTGSYEAAQFLNSLPNSSQISIWTDKKGVCSFFKGKCYTELTYEELEKSSLDYIVISWARKNRTTNIVGSRTKLYTSEIFNFAKYYEQKNNIVYELFIDNRPSQYIKIIKIIK